MHIPHSTPVSATMFTGLNIPSVVFSMCGRFHPPHYYTNSTNTDLQTVLGSNCLRPTSTWNSHFSLHPPTITQKILSYVPSCFRVMTYWVTSNQITWMWGLWMVNLEGSLTKYFCFKVSALFVWNERKSTKAFIEDCWSPRINLETYHSQTITKILMNYMANKINFIKGAYNL